MSSALANPVPPVHYFFYKKILANSTRYCLGLLLLLFGFFNPQAPLTFSFFFQFFLFSCFCLLLVAAVQLVLKRELERQAAKLRRVGAKVALPGSAGKTLKTSFLSASSWFLFLPAVRLLFLNHWSLQALCFLLLLLLFLNAFLNRLASKYFLSTRMSYLLFLKSLGGLALLFFSPFILLFSLV